MTQQTAEQIITDLGLVASQTCGFMAVAYQSDHRVSREALPFSFDGPRALGTALYFLIASDTRTLMHRIHSDQVYHHYSGDPLEVILLRPGGTGEVCVVCNDLRSGLRPQLLIPGGTFHMSRLRRPARVGYALLGTTSWPSVEHSDFEEGQFDQLTTSHPLMADRIADFMRSS